MVSSYSSSDSVTDRLHRPLDQTLSGGNDLNGDEAHKSSYQHNGTDRLVGLWTEQTNLKREMFSTSGQYPGFDRFGRTVSQSWKNRSSGAVLDQVDYKYDYAGNRLTRDLPSGLYATNDRDQKYTYDNLHRLTNAQQGTLSSGSITSRNFEQDWTLDQLGNWPTFKERDTDSGGTWDLNQSRAHNSVNEIDVDNDHTNSPGASITASPGANWIDPKYDAAGNMIEAPKPGAETTKHKYIYDAWNRLVKVTDASNVTIVTMEYDGLGQRIQKVVAGGATHDYYYNEQWQLLTEALGGSTYATYFWHPHYVDALAVRFRSGESHTFLQDGNFNVTAAVDGWASSGDYRDVVERYAYSPYGEVIFLEDDFDVAATQESAIDNTHLYTGREQDLETGLQLNRNRYYAPHLGRWVNRDPIEYEGSPWNLYEYVSGNPVVFSDPSGRIFCCTRYRQRWKVRGYASPADCVLACTGQFYGTVTGWGSVVGGIAAIKYPITSPVLAPIATGLGTYSLNLAHGCDISCRTYECVRMEDVPGIDIGFGDACRVCPEATYDPPRNPVPPFDPGLNMF